MSKNQREMMINFKVKPPNSMVVTMLSPDTFGKKLNNTPSSEETTTKTDVQINDKPIPPPQNAPAFAPPMNTTKEVWQFHNESFPSPSPNPQSSPSRRFVPPSMEKNRSAPSLPVQPTNRQALLVNTKQQSSAPDVLSQYMQAPQYSQQQRPNNNNLEQNQTYINQQNWSQPVLHQYSQHNYGNSPTLPPIQTLTQNIPQNFHFPVHHTPVDQKYNEVQMFQQQRRDSYQNYKQNDDMEMEDQPNNSDKMAISNLIL